MRKASLSLLVLVLLTPTARANPRDLLAPQALRSEALRDAVRSQLELNRMRAVPERQAVLTELYDGLLARSTPTSTRGGASRHERRLWLEYAFGLPTRHGGAVTELRIETPLPDWQDRTRTVVSNAFGSIRSLLDIAWGGRWTGKTSLRVWRD